MKRATWMVAALLGLVFVLGAVHAQGNKIPDVKEIMKRLNKGNDALMPVVRNELQQASPNWTEIQKHTKEYNDMTGALAKNSPPMGSKDSWAQFTRGYASITQEMDNAAQRKDAKAALAAHAKLKTTCMSCHKAHRP